MIVLVLLSPPKRVAHALVQVPGDRRITPFLACFYMRVAGVLLVQYIAYSSCCVYSHMPSMPSFIVLPNMSTCARLANYIHAFVCTRTNLMLEGKSL